MRVLVPVSTFLILFQIFALQQRVDGLGSVIGGLIAAIVGLSLFMLGLQVCLTLMLINTRRIFVLSGCELISRHTVRMMVVSHV